MNDGNQPWQPAASVDAVRKELRQAIFWCLFWQSAVEVQPDLIQQNHEKGIKQQQACIFCQFGVRAGLLTPVEGNDWLDAVWGRKLVADVALKYETEQRT